MKCSLGIDFGTSTTKIAFKRDDNPPVALPISITGDKLFMPSVIAYRRTSNNGAEVYAIGEDAERAPSTGDYQVIRDIKRFLAVKESAPGDFPYQAYPWWNRKENCIHLWAKKLEIEEVISEIVREALNRAVRRLQELDPVPKKPGGWLKAFLRKLFRIRNPRHSDILTLRGWPLGLACPVTASLETRQTLKSVALRIGFKGFKFEHLHEEPILASLPYLPRELHPGDVALVYDFGGGTFDTAIIKIEENPPGHVPTVTVLSAEGNPFCGGVDIDHAFAEYLAQRIASEYFNDDYERKRQQMHLDGQLLNTAREAKELLSSQDPYKVTMPPDFLDKPGIELTLTRKELEEVIAKSRIFDKTENCVLSAWRKARMILRKPNEDSGEFYLEIDRKTGVISKTVFQLGFDDLNDMVSRILLVGGTTKIPVVQRQLTSLLNKPKFITEEDPYQPIVACALGAASQKEHIDSIIDRLPFSIVIRQGGSETEMYRAYSPTILYRTLTDNPKKIDFISDNVCYVRDGTDSINIECRTPDGEVISQAPLTGVKPGGYIIEINSYGIIRLKNLSTREENTIDNPRRHELQIDMWKSIEKEAELEKQEELERRRKTLFKLPGEDHNLEVG